MKCENCGSENIRISVDVMMYIDSKYSHKLTKRVISKKSTELWFANWDKATVICVDCNYISKGC